jgi:hypothetical protein
MKYLKRIFETLEESEYYKLKDFCYSNLAYLIDEGFDISIDRKSINFMIRISKWKIKGNSGHFYPFTWDDIKDDFIPFIIVLNDKFKIDDRVGVFIKTAGDNKWYDKQHIIDDDFGKKFSKKSINYIDVAVKKEYL